MATAAAALTGRARREIQHRFFAADAVRPDRAVDFTPENGFEERQFDQYRDAGVVHSTSDGRCWLDIPAYDDWLRDRFRRTKMLMAAVIVLFAVLSMAESSGWLR